ncbi:saccharopine dehydrogenase NADP-binding domain-containing protein [Nocardia sp. CDC153]|uniref:saccharopine dehydrogenase NADP-binding domain-containing protein n=1 Tax=Nocardia sp. CDC153 TaxID=3112167 RepID=UPI002DB71749|nr:saccharopine dehydrogenase NADP-binding domain-containing protein [Nocardia sp. CDC153]MEC3955412.1 saccharopine dehydrogenase NADP-binding domain-containing protein [Nocardia sp. CDC153]
MTNDESTRFPTIAVYGASGHTGGYILSDLRRRGLTPILVGRNAQRLRAAADAAGLPGAEIRIAAADDRAALVAALTGADVVISSLPGYVDIGEQILAAAIEAGAHYVDISGEQLFTRRAFDEYGPRAEKAGVSVLSGVTDSNLPADLLADLLARRLGPAEFVISHHSRAGGDGSRGSAKTVLASLDWFRAGGWHYADGEFRTGQVDLAPIAHPNATEPTAVAKFAFAAVLTIPRHTDARAVTGAVDEIFRSNITGLTPELVASLPERPGPDSDMRYDTVVDARGADGRTLRGVLSGVDSYRDSGLLAVEAAVRLAAGTAKAGALAPAEAFDAADFLNSLAPHGITWTITNTVGA